jgi:hypothetical protein
MKKKKVGRKTGETREGEIILYTTPNGAVRVEVFFQDESFWLNQWRMAELFDVEVHTINYHLKEIYLSGELQETATIRKIRIVQTEGGRSVAREVDFCNLDAIIAVGYRVNSRQATQFRIWATQVLREFIIKGFVLDAFLKFNEYDILNNAGIVSHEVAKALAEEEYAKFRVTQDRTFESDFERETKKLKRP